MESSSSDIGSKVWQWPFIGYSWINSWNLSCSNYWGSM